MFRPVPNRHSVVQVLFGDTGLVTFSEWYEETTETVNLAADDLLLVKLETVKL